MIGADDMPVFYDLADFAVACTRKRPATADVTFAGILSTVDAESFDGHATRGRHELQYPTASVDLQAGDTVETVATDAAGTSLPMLAWRVWRGPERVVDGAESAVYLDPGV